MRPTGVEPATFGLVKPRTQTLDGTPDFLAEPTFMLRVTQHDGRAIEEALAATLFDSGVRLRGSRRRGDLRSLRSAAGDDTGLLVDPGMPGERCIARLLHFEP
jgi:hypothetical protein